MRILLVIGSLRVGGAEKVLSWIANDLVTRGHQVTIITQLPAACDFFDIDPRVERLSLEATQRSNSIALRAWHIIRFLLLIRRSVVLRRPNVVLSFLTS